MIYVRHNGGCYSDRRVDFIEVPDAADLRGRQTIIDALEVRFVGSPAPRVLAVVASVEWRDPGAVRPLAEWLADALGNYFDPDEPEEADAERKLRACAPLLRTP